MTTFVSNRATVGPQSHAVASVPHLRPLQRMLLETLADSGWSGLAAFAPRRAPAEPASATSSQARQ
ncbi:MAG: hypothetical protein Q7T55_25115 [Solirubrobacteraceae bacterium]|nr:hypothetical protein [Solirubrobacteraceae bacterium]